MNPLSSNSLPPFTATDYLAIRRNWPWLVLVAYLSLCNLVILLISGLLRWPWDVVVRYWPLGAILSEFALVPVWMVWGSRPLVQRVVLATFASLYFFALWWLGLAIDTGGGAGFAIIFLMLIPVVLLGIAFPLGTLRYLLAWRITNGSDLDDGSKPGIRHLLIITMLVACSLALVRGAARIAGADSDEVWIVSAMAAGGTSVASAFLIVPLVWFTLRIKSARLGAVLIGAMAVGLGCGNLGLGTAFRGLPPLPVAFGMFLLPVSFCYTTAAGLWIARASGHRLVTGRRTSLQSVAGGSEESQAET